jgi:hypothetical protein
MPIQNIGTLLENIVVAEAALALLDVREAPGAPLEFANAFAMPPRSPWVVHKKNAGFDDTVLDRVRDADDTAMHSAPAYARLLRANLREERTRGPNAAMLVAGAWFGQRPYRMWLNDVPDGHYGNAIPHLQEISELATATYGVDGAAKGFEVCVADTPYPDSLNELSKTLEEWDVVAPAGARLGFLDPMRYRIHGRGSAETSSEDHKRWLAHLAFEGHTLALQFTGHSDHPSLERELVALHEDSRSEGYSTSLCFKREHYAVFCASRSPLLETSATIMTNLENRVQRAWRTWNLQFASRLDTGLRIYQNGEMAH